MNSIAISVGNIPLISKRSIMICPKRSFQSDQSMKFIRSISVQFYLIAFQSPVKKSQKLLKMLIANLLHYDYSIVVSSSAKICLLKIENFLFSTHKREMNVFKMKKKHPLFECIWVFFLWKILLWHPCCWTLSFLSSTFLFLFSNFENQLVSWELPDVRIYGYRISQFRISWRIVRNFNDFAPFSSPLSHSF